MSDKVPGLYLLTYPVYHHVLYSW